MMKPVILLVLLLLSGCALPSAPPICALGTPMRVFTLYFGRSLPHRGPVTEAEWQAFQAEVITPNLPDGYTVLDGTGAWRGADSPRTITEPVKILIVAEPDRPESFAAVARVRDAYRSAFQQQSVGMTVQPACGDFGI